MIQYSNGKIIVEKELHEEALYHVSNEGISVIFDGKGAICGYAAANEKDFIQKGYLVLIL